MTYLCCWMGERGGGSADSSVTLIPRSVPCASWGPRHGSVQDGAFLAMPHLGLGAGTSGPGVMCSGQAIAYGAPPGAPPGGGGVRSGPWPAAHPPTHIRTIPQKKKKKLLQRPKLEVNFKYKLFFGV